VRKSIPGCLIRLLMNLKTSGAAQQGDPKAQGAAGPEARGVAGRGTCSCRIRMLGSLNSYVANCLIFTIILYILLADLRAIRRKNFLSLSLLTPSFSPLHPSSLSSGQFKYQELSLKASPLTTLRQLLWLSALSQLSSTCCQLSEVTKARHTLKFTNCFS
jgi:hypothetical protein